MEIKKLMASPPVLTLPTSDGRYILYSEIPLRPMLEVPYGKSRRENPD